MRKPLSLLVVFTGGTIGSRQSGHLIDTDADAGFELIARYQADRPADGVDFHACQPLNQLSENLVPDDWLTLLGTLARERAERFDGVVVAHGTDTLPYTAAALSFCLRHLRVPVVLVSSNHPLRHPRSEGHRNFAGAVDFIRALPLPGVYVVAENRRGESVVHLGTRVMQSVPFVDEFPSVADVPFGYMAGGRFLWHEHPLNAPEHLTWQPRAPLPRPPVFADDVLYIRPHPGLNYALYDLDRVRPRAVLHDLNHSGTACVRASHPRHALPAFIEACRSRGIPVYLAPLQNRAAHYATARELRAAGAVALEDIGLEAAWVKLMLACGICATSDTMNAFLEEELFLEFVRPAG